MRLVVGLGNPGKEYENTRHNLGFMFLDFISSKYNLDFKECKFNAYEAEAIIENEKVLFIKPQLFINLSGQVVLKYMKYYNIKMSDLLVIHDDLAMVLGKIKIVYDSRDGGHNGIKNINSLLESKEYLRMKIGIQNNSLNSAIDQVLGKFTKEEKETIDNSFKMVENIVSDFITMDGGRIKDKYNNRKKPTE